MRNHLGNTMFLKRSLLPRKGAKMRAPLMK